MPNGDTNVTNTVLEMMHADRHTVGHYRCTADNRVGEPDARDIFVNVLCKCSALHSFILYFDRINRKRTNFFFFIFFSFFVNSTTFMYFTVSSKY